MKTFEQLGELGTEVNLDTVQRALAYLRRKGQGPEVEQALGLAPYEAYSRADRRKGGPVVREPMEMLGVMVPLVRAFDA